PSRWRRGRRWRGCRWRLCERARRHYRHAGGERKHAQCHLSSPFALSRHSPLGADHRLFPVAVQYASPHGCASGKSKLCCAAEFQGETIMLRLEGLSAAFAGILLAAAALPAHAGPTLDKVKANGVVTCAVNTGLAGFSMADKQGQFTGLDVDVCRAVAAAVL